MAPAKKDEIQGIFGKNIENKVYGTFSALAGAVGVPTFTIAVFHEHDDVVFFVLFILLGLGCLAMGILLLLSNRGAYLTVDSQRLRGRFGLHRQIDISLCEIKDHIPSVGYLSIKLQNGRHLLVSNLLNAYQVSAFLREHTPNESTADSADLLPRYRSAANTRKKWIRVTIFCIVLMLVWIIVAILLTGGFDFDGFSSREWTIFYIFIAVEAVTFVIDMIAASKAGRQLNEVTKNSYQIRKQIITETPMTRAGAIAVYADPLWQTRYVVYPQPGSEHVYYVLEQVTADFRLEKHHESALYYDLERLRAEMEGLREIEVTPK